MSASRAPAVEHGFPSHRAGTRRAVVTIGNFDGVHRGHQTLLTRLTTAAGERDAESVVVTFDPHPRCVLLPDQCPLSLTTLEEKHDLIGGVGVDRFIVLPFTRDMSSWTAEHFCDRLLAGVDVTRFVVGHDFAIGNERGGDIPWLRKYGESHGFDVAVVEPVEGDGVVISSSRVRAVLLNGELAEANHLLGHPYFVDGWVEHGDKIGSRIGYPTANLSLAPNKCLPERGVYVTWMEVAGTWHMAATNVGYRPTFGGDRLTVEAFLLDFAGDIYRQRVRLAFVHRLRDEIVYPGADALVAQIARDVVNTKEMLERQSPPAVLSRG